MERVSSMAKSYHIEDPDKLILRDFLARDRTELAVERTFLAYIRTAIGAFSAGIGCIKFVMNSPVIYVCGMILISAAVFFLVRGIIRYFDAKERISKIPDNNKIVSEDREVIDLKTNKDNAST